MHTWGLLDIDKQLAQDQNVVGYVVVALFSLQTVLRVHGWLSDSWYSVYPVNYLRLCWQS